MSSPTPQTPYGMKPGSKGPFMDWMPLDDPAKGEEERQKFIKGKMG
jgi:hypothetical protein